MSESLYVRLSGILDDLARLALGMDHSPHQFALERLVDRLEACIDATRGLTDALPPDQEGTLTRGGDICPVCMRDACPHWQFLNAEEHR